MQNPIDYSYRLEETIYTMSSNKVLKTSVKGIKHIKEKGTLVLTSEDFWIEVMRIYRTKQELLESL